jgi:two-component system LytT family sensor kinase
MRKKLVLSYFNRKPTSFNKLVNFFIICLFSVFMVLYSALLQVKPGEDIQWHLDAPIWMAMQCFIAQWLTLRWFRYYQTHAVSLSDTQRYTRVFIFSNACFTFAVTGLIIGFESAIGIQTISLTHVVALISMQFILHTIVGGFTLAFKVFEHIRQQHLTLEQTEKTLLSSQVKTLQQHIDPHFLFNNLNVLSALIQQDPDEADEYLNTFSDIYRYILQHKDHTLVPLSQELSFAQQYMALLSTRFDNAYTLKIVTAADADLASLVLPCSIQLAIENAIKHNQGDKTSPLEIQMTITATQVHVFNHTHEKEFKPESTQLGLTNLRMRCEAIFKQSLQIEHTDSYFKLSLPMLAAKAMS